MLRSVRCVEIVCDGCGETLGPNEDGYTVHTSRDAVDETLDAYDWHRDGKTHTCPACVDEAAS